jgi:hypothetical protein
MLQQADAQMKVAKEQSAQERYYFEQEQQERISLLSDYAQRVKMEYDRARSDADRAQRGSQAKAQLLVRVAELEKLQRDIDNRAPRACQRRKSRGFGRKPWRSR